MHKSKFIFIAISISYTATIFAQNLYEEFKNPPLTAKPRALWAWVDGNFDKESISYELKEAKEKGMGGFDIWDVHHVQDEENVVPKGNAFMNDAYTEAIAHAINEATKLDLEIGLIVSSGWNAGGAWTKPENATMGLYRTEIIVDGNSSKKIKLPFPETPKKIDDDFYSPIIETDAKGFPKFYKDIAIIAYPLQSDSTIKDISKVIDLTAFMDKDGNLNWKAPKGKWKIERLVCANTGQPMFAHTPNSKGPMIDHFNPKATEIHIQYFIDKLLSKLGSFKNKSFKYLYSDSYEVIGELWTPLMLEEFEKQFGYSMKPFLPVLKGFVVIDKEASQRFLYDYRQLLSDLIIKSHYKKAKEVCQKYDIGYVAEAAGPGKPLHNCPFESLKSSGVLTHPRGEFWHNSKDDPSQDSVRDILQVIKGVSSASHIYNQKIVDAEAFTSAWLWQESLDELKPTADKAFCEGLNRIVFHTFPHVPKSAGKPGYIYGFGTQVSVNQPWWPMAKSFMDYLARCSIMLQKGNFVGDVLYYYGDEAPNFVPNKATDPSLGYGYDFDVTNSDVILNKLTVKDGKLKLPHGQEYQVLVLPNVDEMNVEVLKKIENLILDGAIVIGKKPTKSTGFKNYKMNDAKVLEISNKIWANIDGINITENKYGKGKVIYGKDIKSVLQSLNIIKDFDTGNQNRLSSVDFIHRKTENEDIYFVCNTKNKSQKITTTYRITNKIPQLWNPMTGEKSVVDFKVNTNSITLDVDLEPNGSVFVVFTDQKETLPNIIQNPSQKVMFSDTIKSTWKLNFPPNLGAPLTADYTKLENLSLSSVDGIKFFSGIVMYSTQYLIPQNKEIKNKNIFLDLGNVAIIASITINGINLGTYWKSPFVIDTKNSLKNGLNDIKIEVANRWPHRLIGDSKLPKEKRITNTNITKLPNGWLYPLEKLPNADYSLLPSGLIGPVKIYYLKN